MRVEPLHHAGIGFLRASIEIEEALDAARFGFVAGRFPRPMRRIKVQAEQEWLLASVLLYHGNCSLAEQIGEIAGFVHLSITIPKVVAPRFALVRVVIESAAAKSPIMIVPALQRAIIRQPAQVPFADERRGVSGSFQDRRKRWMVRR